MTAIGGTEVLELVELPSPSGPPVRCWSRSRQTGSTPWTAACVGDCMRGVPLPRALGVEGAGRVIALNGVTDLAMGQRVVCVYRPGSYAERIVIPAASLVPVPGDIDDHTAASIPVIWRSLS
jgi:NADPH2:quinone reductase